VTGPRLEIPPCGAGDVVVVAAGDRVYGVDLATGERRWRCRLDEPISGGLACTDRSVVVTGRSRVRRLAVEDGRPVWARRLRGTLGPPTIVGEVVVIPTSQPHRLHGIGFDSGEPLWAVDLAAEPRSEAVVVGRRLLVTAGEVVKVFDFADERSGS
jgi:outer membrane protein assembly factor BamB